MDRSFLSQQEVIAASRPFVCVRLTTYESKEEGAFLSSFHVTRSGQLENTVFTVLSPDGKHELARASRSARQTFGDARAMADALNRIAKQYPTSNPAPVGTRLLPAVANVRLALDVAACDNRPLVVLYTPEKAQGAGMEARLASLAWESRFLGQFIYVVAPAARDVAPLKDVSASPGITVVQPDRFGQAGTVLSQAGAGSSVNDWRRCLEDGLERFKPEAKTFRDHVADGHQQGKFWVTVIPVTDPMERQARERGQRSALSPR